MLCTVYTHIYIYIYIHTGSIGARCVTSLPLFLEVVSRGCWAEQPQPCSGSFFNEGRPLWGRAAYTAVHGVRLSSVPSGDRSANPATYDVPGCSDLQRAHISVSSARKRSGAEMLATPSGVSRAASSAFSCRSAIPGYQTSRSDYTRGQSPETGSLSRHLAVWEPLPNVSHGVLPCRLWFYQSSLPRR